MTVHADFLICEYLVEIFSVSKKNSLILFLFFSHLTKIISFSWFWRFRNSAAIWQFELRVLFLWSYSHWRHDGLDGVILWLAFGAWGGREALVPLCELAWVSSWHGDWPLQRKQSKRTKFLWPSLRSTTWWFSPYSVGHTSRL